MKYTPSKIEKKWQKYWETKKLYVTPDREKEKENFYFLVEFPYPSGNLHIGHWYAFSVPDIAVRYWRMRGKNVLYPIGFDAFGLPAENAAIKNDLQPSDWTKKNIDYMSKQLKSMGAAFDWTRVVSTIDPEYYKWTQWIFLQFYKKGLAYRAKTLVNWCPKDKTVLANEQVVNGCCDRCGSEVIQKELSQWMYKITDYADRLIAGLDDVDWPEVTKTAQRNWIGRSSGAEIDFLLPNSKETIKVFTTRADTLFGATYVVLAPEHTLVTKITKDTHLDQVSKYIESVKKKTELERTSLEKEKTGVFTGTYAVNPINNEKLPIWIADYVVGWYGTGAVMAVPAHDERDFAFAKKYGISPRFVLKENKNSDEPEEKGLTRCFSGEGFLYNSGKFDGLHSRQAREEIVTELEKNKLAHTKINYKLHDWVISRQRYWGVPIPMVHCSSCGYQPIPEKDLPVKLPKLEDYKPSSDGRSPLAKAGAWLKIKCPNCNKVGERETDTMDTFVDSSWYFLRYTDPKNKKIFASKEKMKEWLPVDLYSGGAEHNTMHLLYSRFFTKAMYDIGLLDFEEPFSVRKNHGVILGPDSQKMSKSRGNVIDPDDLVKEFGADSIRMYLAFMGPYEQGGPWSPGGIVGISRFLNRVWSLFYRTEEKKMKFPEEKLKVLHRAIKKIGEDISVLKFNTGVSELMKLLNEIEPFHLAKDEQEILLRLLAPFAPHMSEEIWQNKLGHKKSIHIEKWPEYDEQLIAEDIVSMVVQINGRTRTVLSLPAGMEEEEVRRAILSDPKVKSYIGDAKIKNLFFVKNRLINLIV